MRIFIDTSAVTWLAEESAGDSSPADELLGLHRSKTVTLVAGAEVAVEARRTRDPAMKARLEAILEELFPLVPTRLGRSGIARAGLTIIQPGAEKMWGELVSLGKRINNADPTHLLNAHFEKCDYFLHRDGGLRARADDIERIIGTQLVHTDDVQDILSKAN